MTSKSLTNLPASIHQRLLNKARALGKPFNELLQYFVIERFLYRLSCSEHADRFILKGGLMFAIWQEPFVRPTRDIDLLGYGEPAIQVLQRMVEKICTLETTQDGLTFDINSITVTPIRATDIYDGMRIQFLAYLGQARIPIQLDVGFGDVVIPSPIDIQFPTLLDLPEPNLRGYSQESLIAEKFHAMVMRGALTSRVKDFFDLWMLSQTFDFELLILSSAFRETFKCRATELPLDSAFLHSLLIDPTANSTQWQSFLRRNQLSDVPTEFSAIIECLEIFLGPVIISARDSFTSQNGQWNSPGPWHILE